MPFGFIKRKTGKEPKVINWTKAGALFSLYFLSADFRKCLQGRMLVFDAEQQIQYLPWESIDPHWEAIQLCAPPWSKRQCVTYRMYSCETVTECCCECL